jgi:leader peptidase (prepilin peptidase)/N-methyltransferase
VLPRSRCPACGSAIRARDNLPVVSWLLLRGRCRRCGAPIAWRYPLVEALTGALFVAVFLAFGLTFRGLVAAVFACLLVALAAIDLERYLLPDRLTLPGIALGLAAQPWLPGGSLAGAAAAAAAGAAVLLAVRAGWWLLRREEGMGLGDVKMLAMIGAFLGWRGAAVALVAAVGSGAAAGLAIVAFARAGLRAKLPFGAFLALGGLVGLFWGDDLAGAYLDLVPWLQGPG